MASRKRFIDAELFQDEWYCDLEMKYKLAWVYLMTNCGHDGIWKVSQKLLSFNVGENVEIVGLKRALGDRIVELEGGRLWFIPKFITFQYGVNLSKNNNVLKQFYEMDEKYDLLKYIDLEAPSEGLHGGAKVKDKDKDKEKDKEKEEGAFPDAILKIRSSGRITDRIWIKKSLNKENHHLQKHNNIKNTDNNKKTDNKHIREKDKKGKSESVPQIKYAEYVEMTEREYDKLVEQLGSKRRVKSAIAILDNYKGSSGKKYKSDYRAILSWVVDKLEEREHKKVGDGLNYMTLEELDEYERANPEDEIRQKIHEERRRRKFFKGEKI